MAAHLPMRKAESTSIIRGASPSWSPDGRSIVFVNWDENPNAPLLSLVRPDGTLAALEVSRNPLVGGRSAPSWAPDSRRLVYSLWASEDNPPDADIDSPHLYTLTIGETRRDRQLTFDSPPQSAVEVRKRTGASVSRFVRPGVTEALVVSRTVTARLARPGSRSQIEIYAPKRRTVTLARRPAAELSASGSRIVFRTGNAISVLDARTGRVRVVARASATPIGLSIVGDRIAWAENAGRGARIRAVTLARGAP